MELKTYKMKDCANKMILCGYQNLIYITGIPGRNVAAFPIKNSASLNTQAPDHLLFCHSWPISVSYHTLFLTRAVDANTFIQQVLLLLAHSTVIC